MFFPPYILENLIYFDADDITAAAFNRDIELVWAAMG